MAAAKKPAQRGRPFDWKGLGSRLRFARETRQLGLNELGRLAGLAAGQVSRLETATKVNVGMVTVVDLARALNVRLDWLVLGRGGMDDEAGAPASDVVRSAN